MDAGVISMVFASQNSFMINEVYNNPNRSKALGSVAGVRASSMIATALHCLQGCLGIVSCVVLDDLVRANKTELHGGRRV